MKSFNETVVLYVTGAASYYALEHLWRGYSHWTMAIAGGVCYVLIFRMNRKCRKTNIFKKCLNGALIITTVEFITGCIVNLGLKWNVWDYSGHFLNILGQICPVFFALWYLLCFPVIVIAEYSRRKFPKLFA